MRIAKRIIRCQDCAIGFAIPTSYDGFHHCKDSPENRDFVPHRCGAWQKYEKEVVHIFETLAEGAKCWGAEIVVDLEFSTFVRLLDQFSVTILFAHWLGQREIDARVEFYDGLVSASKVADHVPESYSGILDLCVCRPEGLALAIRDSRPHCLVRLVADRPAIPKYWMVFYLHLLHVLREDKYTYLQGYEKAYQTMCTWNNSKGVSQ